MSARRAAQLLLLTSLVAQTSHPPVRQGARREAVGLPAPSKDLPPLQVEKRADAVGVEMQNVDFHIDSGIVLSIKRLRGELLPTEAATPPRLDDKLSYLLSIHAAQISLDTISLSTLLNRHVFGYSGSPLKKLHVSVDGDQLVQTGVMHKVVDMPFRIRASMSLTPDGKIRLHPTAMKVLGMNAAGLMRFFHVRIGGLITLQPGHGASIDQDDFILDPAGMLPPPALRGRLTAIGTAGGRIVQTFGAADGKEIAPLHRQGSTAPNYMYFHGNTLRFGKLTMSQTDLEIVDKDPSNPFDYDPERYIDHLVAGWSQSTESGGLIVHMPDLKLLPNATGAAGESKSKAKP